MLILQTPRLRLRWFTATDADFIRRLLNDPGWRANIGERNVRTRRQAVTWIATRHTATYGRLGFGFWAMERIADGALVGMCGLVKRDSLLEVDVGYALLPAFRGQGYATEAAAACVRYAQDVLGLPEIWAITSPANAASAAVLARIGLRDEGLHRLVGEENETRLFKSPRVDPGDDRAQIDALVRRFFAAFTNRDGAIPTLAALPHYFLPDATIRVADALGTISATDLHGFIAPRAELLLRGRAARLRGTRDRPPHRDRRRHRPTMAALRQARHARRPGGRSHGHEDAAVRAHDAGLADRVAALDRRCGEMTTSDSLRSAA